MEVPPQVLDMCRTILCKVLTIKKNQLGSMNRVITTLMIMKHKVTTTRINRISNTYSNSNTNKKECKSRVRITMEMEYSNIP